MTARVFITGSADGLGRAAAQTLLDDGHEVVLHVRNERRLTDRGYGPRSAELGPPDRANRGDRAQVLDQHPVDGESARA